MSCMKSQIKEMHEGIIVFPLKMHKSIGAF